jgi:hypothetical protein
MAMVRHSSRSKKRDLMLTRDRCDERIESLLKFRRDQVFSILGAVDHMDIIVGIGMAHARGDRFRAEYNMCRAYGTRDLFALLTQPCWAGLTFGDRPSGP